MMEFLKKFACMLALMLMLVGAIWSLVAIGRAHEWVAFVGCCLVIVAAVPTGVELFRYMID